MGSIVSHVDDKIREHGSYDKYLQHLKETSFAPEIPTSKVIRPVSIFAAAQKMENYENEIEVSLDERVTIKLNDKQAITLTHTRKGIKVIADIGSSVLSIKPESGNAFLVMITDAI